VNAVLLRPLPYPAHERLVFVWGELKARDMMHWPTSPPDLQRFRDEAASFDRFEGVATFAQPITGAAGDPEQIQVAAITPGFLDLLGARTSQGRLHVEEDAVPPPPPDPDAPPPAPGSGPPAMVVLGHDLWQRQFGGRRFAGCCEFGIRIIAFNAAVLAVKQVGIRPFEIEQ